MNSSSNQARTQDHLLDSIAQALEERAQTGRANEARYGLVARMANATPPVNEAFRRTLKTRVLAQGAVQGSRGLTSPRRARPDRLWRFAGVSLAIMLMLIATVIFTYRPPQVMERDGVPIGQPNSGGRMTAADLYALAEALNNAEGHRTVVVYPNNASPIAERVRHETVPLVLGKNRSETAVAKAVGAVLPASGYVDLVMAAAVEDDTTHQVRVATERALYRLYRPSGQADVEVYGALERNTYLAGPVSAELEPIGVIFEGGVELVAGGVLDAPLPGRPLRMALDWRIEEPVNDSLVMYVHVLRDGVELVAQRDAVPGNGLFPVTEWVPGEVVRDQFALLLPPTLPAGTYEVQVGLYDAKTQMRHSLVGPEGGTYVVIQEWAFTNSGQSSDDTEPSPPMSRL